jgi:NADH-ubiquinone oxidoreductase chain 5
MINSAIFQQAARTLSDFFLKRLDLMYLLIVFLPLLGSSVAGFFGRFLGSEGSAIITTTCVSFSSIFSLIAFYEVAPGASACYLRIAPWISSEMFDASWGFFGDREVTG